MGMILGLALPTILLMAAAVLATRGIEALLPESLGGMAVTLVLSCLALWCVSSLGFAALYIAEGVPVAALGLTEEASILHFLSLGARAALIWAPIVLLVIVTAPRRWKTSRW